MENTANFTLSLVNAEGKPADEPNCRVQFFRLDGQVIADSTHVQFPPSHTFTLPAFPQAQNLHCAITPSRYRPVQSNFFTLTDGKERKEQPSAMRDPGQWQPAFSRWNSLASTFDALKGTLEGNYVTLKHGPDVGVVNAKVYDGMSSPALLFAKMALLNLYSVLSARPDPVSQRPWFDFVTQILRIDRERIVALVDADLYESIDYIRKNLSRFKKQGFFPGDTSLHADNIPKEFELTAPLISVKSSYEQGNLQFTLAKAKGSQGSCFLLDCDMDENNNLFKHAADTFKHLFTGGTHPIDIHEYIVHAQEGVNLGYELLPNGEPPVAPQALAKRRPRRRRQSSK